MKKFMKAQMAAAMLCCTLYSAQAQQAEKKAAVKIWDGMAVAGYVDQGAFINFGGPTVKWVRKSYSLGFGILPTMRIKKDPVAKESGPRNSAVTPTAGFGFTAAYRHLILQVPFYYNSKTASRNGRWVAGVGIGYRF